jgi:hypothetical protein
MGFPKSGESAQKNSVWQEEMEKEERKKTN